MLINYMDKLPQILIHHQFNYVFVLVVSLRYQCLNDRQKKGYDLRYYELLAVYFTSNSWSNLSSK